MTLTSTPPAVDADLSGDPPTIGDHEGFAVYPMPVYTSVPASDVVASARWYVDALGFGIMYVGPEIAGVPAIVHLRRGKYQDVLLTPAREGVAPAAAGAAQVVLAGGDLEALAARARGVPALGASGVEGPVPTPWGAPELRLTDPDGHRLVFWGPPEQPPAGDIDDAMRKAAETIDRG